MELAAQLWKSDLPHAPDRRAVFLHGMGGTGLLWRPIAIALEDHCAILAPDQRGHGRSLVPHVPGSRTEPRYTPLDYGQDLVETLEARQFHPTFVVGHSMGVRSACALAHLRPDWIKGLVLVDLGFSGPAGGGLGEGLARFLAHLPMRFDTRPEAREFLERECPDRSIAQYLLAVSTPASDGPAGAVTFPFDKGALIATIHAARDASVRTWVKELAARKLPILVLRGETSAVWSRDDFEAERALFASYPSVAFEEFAGAGHGLPFEKRQQFVARLLQFFEAAEAAAD